LTNNQQVLYILSAKERKKMPSGIKIAGNDWGGARLNSGGRRKGAGRPAGTKMPADKRKDKIVYIRLTLSQWNEYVRRGGAKWLRKVLSKGVEE